MDRSPAHRSMDKLFRSLNLRLHLHEAQSCAIETFPGGSVSSIKRQKEYDCAAERTRTLAETHFSGNMGNGKMVSTNSDEGKWIPIAPGSVGQFLWVFACGKK